jgi:hypothetical protein
LIFLSSTAVGVGIDGRNCENVVKKWFDVVEFLVMRRDRTAAPGRLGVEVVETVDLCNPSATRER